MTQCVKIFKYLLCKKSSGILLCSEADEDIARFSVLKGNEQLFATKYKLYLPTEEELKAEINYQKVILEIENIK